MLNIFNLFLVLFSSWLLLAFANNLFTTPYILIGVFASAITSVVSWRMGVINKSTHFIFLHYGFFKHFFILILISFFASIKFTFKTFLKPGEIKPVIYHFPIKKTGDNSIALLIATLAFVPGVLCIGVKNDQLIIHALNQDYLLNAKIAKLYRSIGEINDDRLV